MGHVQLGVPQEEPAGVREGLQRCHERTCIYMRLFSLLNPARKHNPGEKNQNVGVPGPCSMGASGLRSQRPRHVPAVVGSKKRRRCLVEDYCRGQSKTGGSHESHTPNMRNLTAMQKHLRFSIALK